MPFYRYVSRIDDSGTRHTDFFVDGARQDSPDHMIFNDHEIPIDAQPEPEIKPDDEDARYRDNGEDDE